MAQDHLGFATGGNQDAPSVQCPCPTCGSTGTAMVDWARYAGELEALLREARAWVKLPPHLDEIADRLVGADRPLIPAARRPLAEGVEPSPPSSVTGPPEREGAGEPRLAAPRPAPVAAS